MVLVAAAAVAAVAAGATAEPRVAQAAPRSPSTAETPTTPAVKRVTRKASDATVGHLEHPLRLTPLFERMQALEGHAAAADLRILQLGDSHTASDWGTSVARARLASRFGDGGRGFIPMGRPYKRLFQAGETVARGAGFEPDEALLAKNAALAGLYGPTGVAMDARAPGSSMTSVLGAGGDRLEIAYLAQPRGGSFELFVDARLVSRITTAGATQASAFRSFPVARGPHTVEARAVGDGAVRIFGLRLDDEAVGVTFDSLGVNGAKATMPIASSEAHVAEQMEHAAPALVILAYGTNESGDITTTPEEHAAALEALAERLRRSAPGASCMVLGPPDRDMRTGSGPRTLPKLVEIVAAQRRAADEAGCAFYDQLGAMGGADSIGRWASESPPRAQRDLVHLTRAGYAALAEGLVRDVLEAYDASRTPPRP